MKKILFIVCLWLVFNSIFLKAQNINEYGTPRQTIKYGIDNAYEPYEFVDKVGIPKGFNVDLIKAIAKELELEVEVYPDIWRNTRMKLESTGELNVAAYFKSAEREDKVRYSNPISLIYYSIFTHADKEPIEDLFSLSGKKVAIQELTIVEDYFNQLDFLEVGDIQKYQSEPEAIEAVIAGKADCAITTFITTNYKMNLENISSIQSSSDPVFITEYCYVVNKQDSALLDSLNWGLRLVKASGEYDQIYQKWLVPKLSWWEQNKLYVIMGLSLALIALFFIGLYIILLRKQVKKKTRIIVSEVENRLSAERELNESELLRKKIEVFSSVMLVELDLDHKIVKAPKLFYSLLGFQNDTLIDTSIHQLMSKESRDKDLAIKEDLLKREFNFLDTEIELTGHLNQKIWMECSTSVLFDTSSKPIGFLQFMLNVTPLKKANINLKDMNAELANFMYKTSHDIRGPIANILGLSELGKMTTKDKELLNYFQLIEQITRRLEHVFDDFKEVSFVLHGTLNITTFDIKELIDEVLETVFRKRNKDIQRAKLKVNINLDSTFISTDRLLLKRLIFQVAENAFEHNNYYNTHLEITFEKANNQFYRIVFKDDGIGIPEDMHEKVFEVFFKGKRSDINIGMGLYISRKVMNRLGGELYLESHPNEGTRIEVLLPVQVDELVYN
ncbi:transporter substrate-binding domain-containing protein [Marivirga sp. S37H4]|uniref:histidine kinase n=1 Tax=Marivirga aurantiaca TaxID=2802615 RepID=A0A935CA00_9BACT|nr:transporter substrate-binding domain-containing protein [Marivirga aurantiaca]MBK6266305.1 transporter substrate-binding domain-containing protein [Marivirga aurantiaca]